MPRARCHTPIDITMAAYGYEMKVSVSTDKIYELANKEGDRASASFPKWFINEQVEEGGTRGISSICSRRQGRT
ncbi:MAG: ferritin-like domain-containing protein [Candidatus Methanomethylophilaceae archaeon]|jgi:ferritin